MERIWYCTGHWWSSGICETRRCLFTQKKNEKKIHGSGNSDINPDSDNEIGPLDLGAINVHDMRRPVSVPDIDIILPQTEPVLTGNN